MIRSVYTTGFNPRARYLQGLAQFYPAQLTPAGTIVPYVRPGIVLGQYFDPRARYLTGLCRKKQGSAPPGPKPTVVFTPAQGPPPSPQALGDDAPFIPSSASGGINMALQKVIDYQLPIPRLAPKSWLDQDSGGIPNKYLVFGSIGLVALLSLGGSRRR